MDIVKEIIRKLDSLYPEREIYGESIPQGFTPGCFSVRQISASSQGYPAGRYYRPQAVDVRYFPMTDRPAQECREIAQALAVELETVGGVRGAGMEWETTDEVLHFFVQYNTFVTVRQEKILMEDLTLESKAGG